MAEFIPIGIALVVLIVLIGGGALLAKAIRGPSNGAPRQ